MYGTESGDIIHDAATICYYDEIEKYNHTF